MPTAVNEQTNDTVNNNNTKILGEEPALSTIISRQNAVAQQARRNENADAVHANALQFGNRLAEASGNLALQIASDGAHISKMLTARVARYIFDISSEQAVGFDREIGSGLISKLADIEATLNATQQGGKIAASTLPESGILGELVQAQAVLSSAINQNQALLSDAVARLVTAVEELRIAMAPKT